MSRVAASAQKVFSSLEPIFGMDWYYYVTKGKIIYHYILTFV